MQGYYDFAEKLFANGWVEGLILLFVGTAPSALANYAAMKSWEKRIAEPQRIAEREDRKKQLLEYVAASLEKNLSLLKDVRQHLAESKIPTFNFDLAVLDATASLKYELASVPLCSAIDSARFELWHAARKIEVMFTLYFNPESRRSVMSDGKMTTSLQQLLPTLQSSLSEQLATVEKECTVAKSAILSATT